MPGLAIGDALGTTAEFQPRGSFPEISGMVGGGPFGPEPGQWTDDTSMNPVPCHLLARVRRPHAIRSEEAQLRMKPAD